jgi:prepilin-type processing-associated H-X9-DG protein
VTEQRQDTCLRSGVKVIRRTPDQFSGHPPRLYRQCELAAGRVKRPAEMIAIADGTADRAYDVCIGPQPRDATVLPGKCHGGGANVLFCDGHVQWYLQEDLHCADGDDSDADRRKRRMWNNDNEP